MNARSMLGPALLVFSALSGCASNPGVVKLSSDTYSLSATDKGGSMSDIGSTKTQMEREANDFAAKQGKVVSPVSMKDTPTAVQGFTAIEYQFKLVDKGSLPPPVVLATQPAPMSVSGVAAPALAAPAAQPVHSHDIYAELIKLDELRKRGILTEDEFTSEKKKILNSN